MARYEILLIWRISVSSVEYHLARLRSFALMPRDTEPHSPKARTISDWKLRSEEDKFTFSIAGCVTPSACPSLDRLCEYHEFADNVMLTACLQTPLFLPYHSIYILSSLYTTSTVCYQPTRCLSEGDVMNHHQSNAGARMSPIGRNCIWESENTPMTCSDSKSKPSEGKMGALRGTSADRSPFLSAR